MASLHNHSFYSLLDSTMSPEYIVEQAHDLGFKAVAITEHGNMHSFLNGYKKAKELGIKYIFGMEAYETDDMDYKESDSSRYHLLLLAKNETGLKNLFKISSEGSTRGFYGKPRIDRDFLREHSEGLICASACLASRLMRLLQQGFCPCCKMGNNEHKANCDYDEEFVPKWEEAKKELQIYKNIFGDDFYIELQSHDTHDQMVGNQRILQLAKETNTKYIITFDAHMPDGSDKTRDIHRKFIKIAQNSREVGETYKDCYQQDMETMYNILVPQIGKEAVDQAILYTGELADKCSVDIDLDGEPLMPHIEVPEGFNSQLSYLKHLINEGWEKRGIHKFPKEKQKQYKKRIYQELDVLEYLDYIGYFLILHKIVNEFKKHNIPLGYSRGSGAGCLILWIIGVTEIDSIRWDLDFSRFANKGRKSMADYDMDISKRKRNLALKLLDEMFGKENVAQLCTFNSLSPKVALKDLGKVFNEEGIYKISYQDRDKMSKLIPDGMTIEEALEHSGDLRRYQRRFPALFEYASTIQNFPKSVGCHASAVIISDTPIIQHAPVMLNKEKRIMMQVEMGNAEKDLKLVKFDFLGLISLDTIDDTLKLAGLSWDDIDLQHLDSTGKLDDKDVLENIYSKGNTIGIFQMEKQTPQMLFKKMYEDVDKEDYDVEDVIAVNAINRPAILGVGMHNNYIKGKKDHSSIKNIHKDLEPIFEKTYGVCIAKGEKVQTIEGEKSIEEITEGDLVYTLNGLNRVKKAWSNGEKEVMTVMLSNGKSITCTPEHKVLTQNGWKMARDLSEKDSLAYRIGNESTVTYNENLLTIIANLLGDGMLTNRNYIGFMNSNRRVIERYVECVTKEFNDISDEIKIRESRVNKIPLYYHYASKKNKKSGKSSYWKYLNKLGMKWDGGGVHANDKSVPEFIFGLSRDSLLVFLGAFFDTDGSFTKNGDIRFKTSSEKLSNDIQLIGRLLGYSFTITKNFEKSFDITCKNSGELFNELRNTSIILSERDFDLSKKRANPNGIISTESLHVEKTSSMSYTRIASLLGMSKSTFSNIMNRTTKYTNINTLYKMKDYFDLGVDNDLIFNENIIWNNVIGVTECSDKIEVFDLEIENEHNFVVNGYVVHNCLYQEQALQIFRLAGFPEENVDNARRSIGKKIPEEMEKLYDEFYRGLSDRNWSKEQIDEIWELIEAQATYSFNRSHSVSYGLLSYVMAYLKHYYPVEFMTALLTSEIGDYEQTTKYIDECRNMGIKILPPDVNASNETYSIKEVDGEKCILFGLSSIKGMGNNVVARTIEERKNKKFEGLKDYIERVNPDKTSIISLIKSGAFGLEDKNGKLLELFEYEYEPTKWSEIKTRPTKKKLYELGLIKSDEEFKDKQTCIDRYNEYRYKEYLEKEKERKEKQLQEFKEKYLGDESMYEYNTLSIFLNGTPFDEYKNIFKPLDSYPDGHEKILIGGTITEIQRKKDKNGNQYAYIWMLTVHDGMQECIAFASTYSEYNNMIEKGNNVVCLVKRSGSQFVLSKMRTFDDWKQAIERKKARRNKNK